MELTITLLGDGTSDRILFHPIKWSINRCGVDVSRMLWADLGALGTRPDGLRSRVVAALEYYPCDVLFVHRDAEGDGHTHRVNEIEDAIVGIEHQYVPVVPVRMSESWFLHDESAIRTASGNPNGRVTLNLPNIRRIEYIADPKSLLRESVLTASEHTGRRRERLLQRYGSIRARIAELVEDYDPLIGTPAFDALCSSVELAINRLENT